MTCLLSARYMPDVTQPLVCLLAKLPVPPHPRARNPYTQVVVKRSHGAR
jgi:hypothetical protein